jgi:hypothetical protein
MSNMTKLLKQHGPEYLRLYGSSMPEDHKKVLNAIMNCRQGHYGYSDHYCEDCYDHVRLLNCCGNRHCPSCQNDKNQYWLAKQMDKLLPIHYFMLTFTLPSELRPLARSNQRIVYEAMFKASSEAMMVLASDSKHIGCDKAGFFGVLHTWGRDMYYHPHIHYIVPGGGLKDGKWVSSKAHYYVPAEPLSKLFRGKFVALLKEAGLGSQIPQAVWSKDWVLNVRAVGDGQSSLKYLAPYVSRVAISDKRIKKVTDTHVTFEYKPSNSQNYKNMELPVMKFIHRFLQHTLPTGFMKIRHYGFMHSNCATKTQTIRELICVLYEVIKDMVDESPGDKIRKAIKLFSCKHCEGIMIMVEFNHHPYYGKLKGAPPDSGCKP